MKVQTFLLYRIYYGDTLIYIGRTKQLLQSCILGHLFAKPIHRTIAIEQVLERTAARVARTRYRTEHPVRQDAGRIIALVIGTKKAETEETRSPLFCYVRG